MQIKEDAIFIADAHYNYQRVYLLALLKKIEDGSVPCSQLFLMGDIFDFIAGEVKHFIKANQEVVSLIQNLSAKIETFYFEGNHDYNLKKLFPNATVFKRENQPVQMRLKDKTVELSHGDIFTPKGYDIYCTIIRNTPLLSFLNLFDIAVAGWISKTIIKKLAQKKICRDFKGFEELTKKRIKNYNSDIVIEGHFHQGKIYKFEDKEYINIPSLACGKKYARYKDNQFNWEE